MLNEVDLKLKRGDRIALLGPNGAGKSTLLRLLAGAEQPTKGNVEYGHAVVTEYFAQRQAEALEATRSVLDETLYGLDSRPEPLARNLLGRLLLRGEAVFKPVSVLSGGERSRVALAKFLLRPANFLLLDEPTNHLDSTSREVLIEALKKFDGTLVVASHDRAFVDAVAHDAYTLDEGRMTEDRVSLVPPKKKEKGKAE